MSPDRNVYKRKVYTCLDWLGDVGGLFDALHIIGSFLVFIKTLVRGNLFEMFILHKLYKMDTKDLTGDKDPEPNIHSLKTRNPFFLPKKFCHCLRSKKEKHLLSKGLERTLKELEIDHFIRT